MTAHFRVECFGSLYPVFMSDCEQILEILTTVHEVDVHAQRHWYLNCYIRLVHLGNRCLSQREIVATTCIWRLHNIEFRLALFVIAIPSEKETWLNKKNSNRAHQLMMDLASEKQGRSSTIQIRSWKCLKEGQDVLSRWTDYFSEVYSMRVW